VEWTRELIRRRGRPMIVIARFIPGGRTAATVAAGSLGMSYRRFLSADVPAAGLWAAYVCALGFLGGNAFEHSLWKPLLAAAVVAAAVTALGEAYRRLRLRPRRPNAASQAPFRTM
jgi:membrane protein DedA with SNARE-associated domain